MKHNYNNLMVDYYKARIDGMSNHIKKLNGKIECLEGQIQVCKEAHFKDWKIKTLNGEKVDVWKQYVLLKKDVNKLIDYIDIDSNNILYRYFSKGKKTYTCLKEHYSDVDMRSCLEQCHV